MVECTHGFFHGTSAIRSMGVDKVYIVELEPFESEVGAFDDTLAGETNVIDCSLAIGLTPVDLFHLVSLCGENVEVWGRSYFGRNNQIVSFPAKFLNGLTHDPFGFSTCVALGTVEKVDSRIIRSFHACKRVFYVCQSCN